MPRVTRSSNPSTRARAGGAVAQSAIELARRGLENIRALPPELVEGTTEGERSALASLGAVAGALVPSPTMEIMPPEVRSWLTACEPAVRVAEDVANDIRAGYDPLGDAYIELVSPRSRRVLGTFFTPDAVAEHMLDAWGEVSPEAPATVVDPGAGVGVLTLRAVQRWPGAKIIAVDLNVVTLGLLVASCGAKYIEVGVAPDARRMSELGASSARVFVHRGDYLSWVATSLPSVPGPRLILGNPPYTRHQQLNAKVKAAAQLAAGPLVPSGLAGMSTYFLAASLRALRPADGLCLLLPGGWLQANYGRCLREHLWGLRRPVLIEEYPTDSKVFQDANVDATLLVVGPRVEKLVPLRSRRAHLSKMGSTVVTTKGRSVNRGMPVPSSFRGLASTPRRAQPTLASGSGAVRLREIALVRRGLVTGAKSFFVLDDAAVKRLRLPPRVLVRTLARLRDVTGTVLDDHEYEAIGERGRPRWLLRIPDGRAAQLASVSRYLAAGEKAGLHLGELCSRRERWWELETVGVPSILIGPMTKREIRVVENPAGVVPLNAVFGLWPKDGVDAKALASYLRSESAQAAMIGVARRYSSGLIKLEPRMLQDLPLPAGALELVRSDGG